MKKHQRGYTLIELAVSLVILTLVIGLIFQFSGVSIRYSLSEAERDLIRASDEAVGSFVYSNHRLPCPDSNNDGVEDCAAAVAVGKLPYKTIGMPDARAAQMRYGVYRAANPAVPILDADLAVTGDRMRTLNVNGSPLAGRMSYLTNRNGIDFCAAIRNGANATTSTAFVHTINSGALVKNVAFAIALPGASDADNNGSALDGVNSGATTAFETSARVIGRNYDDGVATATFEQLWSRLGCGEVMAAATHAHANVASATEINYQSMQDFKIQLDLANLLADAATAAAAAGVVAAAGGLALAGAEAALGVAQAIMSLGALAAVTALAIAAVVVAGLSVVAAAAAVVAAVIAKADTQANVNNFLSQGFVIRARDMALRVRQNANAADAAGLY